MSSLNLSQPGFTYSVCGPFTKHCQRIQNFKETVDLKYIYKKELDKTRFAHESEYDNDKHLIKNTVSYKFSKDRAYEVAINSKYDGYKRGLASIEYTLFHKKIR